MNPKRLLPMILVGLTLTSLGQAAEPAANHKNLTLDQALRIALKNHRSLQVSQATLDMAEAQYQQAMAAFRPRLGLEAGYQRADEDRTYSFDAVFTTPATDATGLVNATLAAGGHAVALPAGSVMMPGQTIPVNMDAKLFSRDVARAGLNLAYPLYTGGKKEALTGIARKGVDIAREEKRKTELEVARDVTRYYHGAQFARHMEQLASDTLERFQVLEELTERLYQNASLKVKKTDYLRSKTTTAMTRSVVRETGYASALTREALANAMGLPVNTPLTLAPEGKLPAFDTRFERLLADAQRFNPDKQRLELAIQAAEHKIDDARSGYYPMVGLEANVYRLWNDYHSGLINHDNQAGWTLGLGLKWNLLDGGLTKAEVDAARAGRMKLEAQRTLLDNGLALQIKDALLRLQRSRLQLEDNGKAQSYAEENRKLNVRAYQEELVETKDVIEAQIVETLASASLYRARHELHSALADLDYQVGKALQKP